MKLEGDAGQIDFEKYADYIGYVCMYKSTYDLFMGVLESVCDDTHNRRIMYTFRGGTEQSLKYDNYLILEAFR